jgi:WS/DGAT/MGAT family acyltransferase
MNLQESLSGLDTAFLSLETPTTPMHVMGVFVLDASGANGGYSYQRVLRLIEQRVPGLAPFRRRLVEMPVGLDHPVWVDDPDLDVRSHVHKEVAPAPGSERILSDLVARFAAQPLDRTCPLWQLWVVEGLSEGRVALVFKLHHSVADGVSAALLLMRLLGSSLQDGEEGALPVPMQSPPIPTRSQLLAHAVSRLPRRSVRFARLMLETAESLPATIRSALGGTEGSPRLAMPFGAPRTPWNRAISSGRSVAFGAAPLADVKRVAAAFDATVNQVVLAACARTLRSYLQAHGGAPDVPLVAAIPVSVRGPEDLETYGNRISAMLVHLPTHLAEPEEQLLAVRNHAASAKQRQEQAGAGPLGEWAELLSTRLLEAAARFYSEHALADHHRPFHNLVISNVRGPTAPLYAAGARLIAAYPLGPLMEGAGINITVMSYAGSVDFGIVACERAVPCASDIALGFGTAVADLHKIALERTRSASGSHGRRAAPKATPPPVPVQ